MPDNRYFKIRPMRSNDLDQAFSLSKAEGWNQTEKDWRFLLEDQHNKCLVAEFDNNVAGTATALNHSDEVAWIGMVLVDKSLRGQGIGKMLLSAIIEALKQIRSIKLDATPAGEPLYRNLGFIEEYKIFRMTNSSLNEFNKLENDIKPQPMDHVSFSEIAKLDSEIFGTDRTILLKYLFQDYPEKAFLMEQNHKTDGYIFGRDGVRFNYIGPVSALSSESARILIAKALETLEHKPVALDIPEDKEDLIKWLESLGFVRQRQFIRMYLGKNYYPGKVVNQYLISGPEFG